MSDIENIPEYIYDKLLNDERLLIYIDSKPLITYLDELEKFDFKEFIIYHLSNYPTRYCIKIFGRVLPFWKTINMEDIEYIMTKIEYPAQIEPICNFYVYYFNINFLKILQRSNYENAAKLAFFSYFKYSFSSELYENDFVEEEYLMSLGITKKLFVEVKAEINESFKSQNLGVISLAYINKEISILKKARTKKEIFLNSVFRLKNRFRLYLINLKRQLN